MGDFLETRASPSAGAACEHSVGVPWELGLEQKIRYTMSFCSRCVRSLWLPWPGAALAEPALPWDHRPAPAWLKPAWWKVPKMESFHGPPTDPAGPQTTSMEQNHSPNALHSAPLTLLGCLLPWLVRGECQKHAFGCSLVPKPALWLVWTSAA